MEMTAFPLHVNSDSLSAGQLRDEILVLSSGQSARLSHTTCSMGWNMSAWSREAIWWRGTSGIVGKMKNTKLIRRQSPHIPVHAWNKSLICICHTREALRGFSSSSSSKYPPWRTDNKTTKRPQSCGHIFGSQWAEISPYKATYAHMSALPAVRKSPSWLTECNTNRLKKPSTL